MKDIHIVAIVAVSVLAVLALFTTLNGSAGENTEEAADGIAVNETGEEMEVVVLETNKGKIEMELYPDKAPVTVKNFLGYVNAGFYDGTVFHRVIPGFMVQGGGFTQEGKQKETEPPIKLESDNGLKNKEGTVAMARTNDPNSATSQFFINLENNSFLDYTSENDGYAVFGKVVSGMDVVNEIAETETSRNGFHEDWPVEDIVIEKAYVKE